jgi:glycosyltransferase involved in cell wall biosynthesis
VHVVTATPPDRIEDCPAVFVHHREPRRTLNDFYLAASRGLRRAGQSGTSGASSSSSSDSNGGGEGDGAGPSGSPFQALRENVSQFLSFPDSARGWVLPAAMEARRLLDQQRFDLMVSSGPPHSAHLAAALVARGRSVPYWVDMRDPWGQFNVEGDSRTALMRYLHTRLERSVFSTASLILTNSTPYADHLRGLYDELPVETIPNGVDLDRLPTDVVEPFPELTLAHVGSIYLGRDVGTVLKAMRLAADASEGRPLRLWLVGGLTEPHRSRVHRQVEENDLGGNVEIQGRLPRPEALEILRRSTFAVVLAQGQPLQVPAKLYECVALGLPTIVITEPDSATASEGRRIGAFVFGEAEHEALGRLLVEARSSPPRVDPGQREALSYAGRTRVLQELVQARLG